MAKILTKRWNDPPAPEDGTRISVTRYRAHALPKVMETWVEWNRDVALSWDLHAAWYGNHGQEKIFWDEYARRCEREMAGHYEEAIRTLAERLHAGKSH